MGVDTPVLISLINLLLLMTGAIILIIRNSHRNLAIGLLISSLVNMTGLIIYIFSESVYESELPIQRFSVFLFQAIRINVYIFFILLILLVIVTHNTMAKTLLSVSLLVAVVNIAFPFFLNIFETLSPFIFQIISSIGALCYCMGCVFESAKEEEHH